MDTTKKIINMDTRLTKEDQAMIKEAKDNKFSGPIYSEDGLRLLRVLGNPEYLEVEDGVKAICDEACQGLDNLNDVKKRIMLYGVFDHSILSH
jgi:hypothetical protein